VVQRDLTVPIDLTSPPDLTPPPPDLVTPPDLIPQRPVGDPCTVDQECVTGLCRPVLALTNTKLCVAPCQTQTDCTPYLNHFCEAVTSGSTQGYCIPRSPAHCASCAQDSDCGGLSERCAQILGDTQKACHIDCSLGGAEACPPDYTCTAVNDGGVQRQLCVPRDTGGNSIDCLDALGGYCERVSIPITCVRSNNTGTCTGQRVCLSGTRRYDKCGAQAPQYKTSCTDQNPAGCTLLFKPGIATTKTDCGTCGNACGANQDCCNQVCTDLGTSANCAGCGNVCGSGSACCNGSCTALTSNQNCGGCGTVCGSGQGCCNQACTSLNTASNCVTCGNVCPGQSSTADAFCTGTACDLTCKGENYDYDGSVTNSCERVDSPTGNHEQTQLSAVYLGSFSDYDPSSQLNFGGLILSDQRVHYNPSVVGFDSISGSAPDFFRIFATGGSVFYPNDVTLNMQVVSALGRGDCYRMTATTNSGTYTCAPSAGTNTCGIAPGSSSYGDNTTIYVRVEKICPASVRDSATYTITGHL
jgi:hypothetical protein